MAENKARFIRISGQLVSVSEEIYQAHHKMRRREKYLIESDEKNGTVSYHALDTDELNGEDLFADTRCDVEEEAINNILIEKLLRRIAELSEEERFLINELYYKQKSLADLSRETGILGPTIRYRMQKILSDLKSILES